MAVSLRVTLVALFLLGLPAAGPNSGGFPSIDAWLLPALTQRSSCYLVQDR
jgi:hypothetical protein